MTDIELAQRLCRAANANMRAQIELFSSGVFTRIALFYRRGEIVLVRAQRTESQGTRVHCISNTF